jgi:uncharacterized protein
MSSGQNVSLVLDTGVLVELAVDSPKSAEIRNWILEGEIQPVTGELNVLELSYLLCRRVGRENAQSAVSFLRKSTQFKILPSSSFLDLAADMKCDRRISLVDCVTISMAESLGIPVLFAGREKEIELEIKKRPFRAKFRFMANVDR